MDEPVKPPIAMLAELTHRCPLQCPYCSNPVQLVRRSAELDTATWIDLFRQAAALGVLQVHLSGGEPTARTDLEALVAAARAAGLYCNLITAGVLLTEDRIGRLAAAGVDHIQLSLQGSRAASANLIANFADGHARKLQVAGWITAAGLPLTVNAVVHRQNLDDLPAIIDLAVALGAHRLEIANVQYYGWALRNRDSLMPTADQVERSLAVVAQAKAMLKGRLVIDFVAPDYFAHRPKKCMDGWASQYFAITPRGRMLPCHAAETITGFDFPSVRDRPLRQIWYEADLFNRFRGTAWMQEPCRSCAHRTRDLGGCRCQAFALTGDAAATDPACALSPHHAAMGAGLAESMVAAAAAEPSFIYRR